MLRLKVAKGFIFLALITSYYVFCGDVASGFMKFSVSFSAAATGQWSLIIIIILQYRKKSFPQQNVTFNLVQTQCVFQLCYQTNVFYLFLTSPTGFSSLWLIFCLQLFLWSIFFCCGCSHVGLVSASTCLCTVCHMVWCSLLICWCNLRPFQTWNM